MAYSKIEKTKKYIIPLREHLRNRLKKEFHEVILNSPENELYTVLNVNFPASEKNELLLFNLDIAGIAVSGGSACSSGSSIGSHVIAHLHREKDSAAVRFSFCKFNTMEEVDFMVDKLKEIVLVEQKV